MKDEALKLALEALITITDAIYVNSQQEADAVYKANDAITAINKALAQEQEPAAIPQFRVQGSSDWYDGYPDYFDGGGVYETRTLYTTPPQRPWVDLTPQDLNEIFAIARTGEHAVRLALDKIKEKNT
jgi:hypothetical protein